MLRASQQPQSQVLELTRDNRAAVFKGDLEKYFKLEMCSWIRSIPTSIIFAKDRFTADDLKLARWFDQMARSFPSFVQELIKMLRMRGEADSIYLMKMPFWRKYERTVQKLNWRKPPRWWEGNIFDKQPLPFEVWLWYNLPNNYSCFAEASTRSSCSRLHSEIECWNKLCVISVQC